MHARGSLWRSPRDPAPPVVRVVAGVLLVEVAVFLVSTVPGVRATEDFSLPLDGWLQALGYLTATALVLLRPALRPADRAAWAWIGAALGARALGFVLWLAVVRPQEPTPYPSVADAGWLAMYLLMLVGLALLVRERARLLTSSLLLDGAVAGLAAASVAVTLLYPTLVSLAAPGTPRGALAVNLAYPVLDVVLAVAVIWVLLLSGRPTSPSMCALAGGLAGFAVADGVYLHLLAAGDFRPGTLLSSGSLALMALVALAGWLPGEVLAGRRPEPLPGVVLPVLFSLVCLGVLVYATRTEVPSLGVACAGGGLVAATARTALSFRAVRGLAEHRREARTDELTGLANRRAFNEALERALGHASPQHRLALLVVDLDDFKAVNDALGHHYGDELLRQAASRLQQALRGGDLVARIGGDEFGVLLPDADGALAVAVAERLRAGFRRSFRLGPRDVVIAPSVGIALAPDDGRDPVQLLQHADLAMYDAKAARSGQALYRRELHPTGRIRLETAERLRRAIEDGELVLHYQPQVALPSGAVSGVEALVRWEHPESGLLPPSSFLAQAESAGLMPRLTVAVLDQALRQVAAWHAQGLPVTVAVNLSVTNLLDPSFPEHVVDLLAVRRLPAGTLELELTEDLFMADPARARGAVAALLEAGVGLVIDDYGTGYSSLGYLRDLHEIRGLKLDRSFVADLDTEPRSAAIVESTVDLAHALGMHVVAEGVETPAVRDRLADLGCEFAQGYLFSRPLPPGELALDALLAGDGAAGVAPGPPGRRGTPRGRASRGRWRSTGR
ncbi:putative bifunctional diguanylate cyclase/phosphodiesterase [Modestobacter marinus]|uniref:putative bifunctional diguanylate cyclase/phosphodiesterase n=1 Tax=Modestobacter marinus TaxID=477641 RepID=UPI001C963BEE|nr:EAL domain-containing protein [Modestobacter marinus]